MRLLKRQPRYQQQRQRLGVLEGGQVEGAQVEGAQVEGGQVEGGQVEGGQGEQRNALRGLV